MCLWLEQPEGRFVLYMWVLTVKVYKHPLLSPVSRVRSSLIVSPSSPSPFPLLDVAGLAGNSNFSIVFPRQLPSLPIMHLLYNVFPFLAVLAGLTLATNEVDVFGAGDCTGNFVGKILDENSPSGCAPIGMNKMSVKAVQKTNPLCNSKSSPEEGRLETLNHYPSFIEEGITDRTLLCWQFTSIPTRPVAQERG